MKISIEDDTTAVHDAQAPQVGHRNLVRSMHAWLRTPPYGEPLRVLVLYHAPRGKRGERLRTIDLVEGPKRTEREIVTDVMQIAHGHAEVIKGEQPFLLEAFFGDGTGNKDICSFSVTVRPDDDGEEGVDYAGTDRSERRQVQRGIDALGGIYRDRLASLDAKEQKIHDTKDKLINTLTTRVDKLESVFDGTMLKRVGAIEAVEMLKDRSSSRSMDEEERRSRIKMKENFYQFFQMLLPIVVSKFRLGGGTPQPMPLTMPAPFAPAMLTQGSAPAAPPAVATAAAPQMQPAVAAQPGVAPVAAQAVPSALSYLDGSYVPPAPPAPPPVAAPQAPQAAAPAAPAAPQVKDLDSAMGRLRYLIVNADDSLVTRLMPALMSMSMPQQATISQLVQKCRSPEGPGQAELVGLQAFFESLDAAASERFMRALPQEIKEALAAVAYYMCSQEQRDKIDAMNAAMNAQAP